MTFLPVVLDCGGGSWSRGHGWWPSGGLGAWGGTRSTMQLLLVRTPSWQSSWALWVRVSCCPPGGLPGGPSLWLRGCRARLPATGSGLPSAPGQLRARGRQRPPQPCVTSQTPLLIGGSHTGQAARELVSTCTCPELSPISSRAGGKGVWVCPGGYRHPRSPGPGGGGNHDPCSGLLLPPFAPSATSLVSARRRWHPGMGGACSRVPATDDRCSGNDFPNSKPDPMVRKIKLKLNQISNVKPTN